MTFPIFNARFHLHSSLKYPGIHRAERWQEQPKTNLSVSNSINSSLQLVERSQKRLSLQIYNKHSYSRIYPSLKVNFVEGSFKDRSQKRRYFSLKHISLWRSKAISGLRSYVHLTNSGSRYNVARKQKTFINKNDNIFQRFIIKSISDESTEFGFRSKIDCNREGQIGPKISRTSPLKRSRLPGDIVETTDESGYVIKVSKEMMGIFQYVEKVKRARLRELSETLRQVALASFFFSFVKGLVTPLVEVFKTRPPSWGKLITILGAFDAFAITYLAMKALEPLERLSSLATECDAETDMMGSIEKEEEHMLALAIDLVKLFRRLRNLALCNAVTQFAHILHALLQLQKSYPNFAINLIKFVKSWLSTPWA